MKITKSQLRKIIKEELLKEGGFDIPPGEQANPAQIRVEWDTDGEGEPPPDIITIHTDSIADYEDIKAEEGEDEANQAISDMITNETGWLVMGWEWV